MYMYKRRILICALLLCAAVCLTLLAPVISASAAAGEPVADNLEVTTYRNVSVGGRLTATDPDGGELTFELTTEPTKGKLELESDGRFVYSPNENRRGRDYFGFRAVDSDGNRSQEATVIIKIEKQKTAVSYKDTEGLSCAYAAVRLAEEGIFTGEKYGSAWFFSPDETVTRGEFLAMCMELAGEGLLSGVSTTGFLDDAEIPAWQKTYVATALMNGSVSGYGAAGGAVFAPGVSVTKSEAAVMLSNCLGLSDAVYVDADALIPAWAAQSVANLEEYGVAQEVSSIGESLTRGETAELLVAALDAGER